MEKHQPKLRRRYSPQERQNFVTLLGKSDLTQSAFARQHDIKLCTLQQWLYSPARIKPASRAVFKEVFLPPAIPVIEVCVGNDITVKLSTQTSPEFLAEMIQHLRHPC